LTSRVYTGGHLFLEVDPCHAYLLPEKVDELKASHHHFRLELQKVVQDFAQKDRFVILAKR
jgi:hypothetical protein